MKSVRRAQRFRPITEINRTRSGAMGWSTDAERAEERRQEAVLPVSVFL